MQYIINIQQYNIIEGSLGRPPYSLEQYNIAKANGDGIQAALNYASENGYSEVILPRGEYSVCYHFEKKNYAAPIVLIPSRMTLNLNYSTIDVIFDSLNRSPFDTSTDSIYALRGVVFQFEDCYDSKIKQGTLKGDIYNRAFSDNLSGYASEKGMEQTYGIHINERAHNIKVVDLDIHGFMGDAIGGKTVATVKDVCTEGGEGIPGYINDENIVEEKDGCYHSPLIMIDREKLAKYSPYSPNTIQMQTMGGGTRLPKFGENLFEIILYLSDGTISRRVSICWLGFITLQPNEVALRVIFFNEEVGLESLPMPDAPYSYTFTDIATSMIVVQNCRIHDNHRGGISNIGDFATITGNIFFNNGLDSSIGAPLFPDSTRYHIDLENTYAKHVVIEDNNFHSGFNSILLSTDSARVVNNNFSNITQPAVTVYNCQQIIIDGNKMDGCAGLAIMAASKKGGTERCITFSNNRVSCGKDAVRIIATEDKPNVLIKDNFITCTNISMQDYPNLSFINNVVKLNGHYNYRGFALSNLNTVADNKFYGKNVNEQRSYSVNNTHSRNNYFEGINFADFGTIDKEIIFDAGYYKDCNFSLNGLPKNATGHYKHIYKNSTFDDCVLSSPNLNSGALEGFTWSIDLYECIIKIVDKIPIRCKTVGHKSAMDGNVSFYACDLEYLDDSSAPVLIQAGHPKINAHYNISMLNTQYRGVDDLSKYITEKGKVEN